MLTKITIEDNTKSPLSYLDEIPSFKNGTVFNFKPGINIIVGLNGCGKSTLMKLIQMFTFTEGSTTPRIPARDDMLSFPSIFKEVGFMNSEKETLLDGVKINMDYNGLVFRFLPGNDMQEGDTLKTFNNVCTWYNSRRSSTGEAIVQGVSMLFHEMFKQHDSYNFPIKELKELRKICNDTWKNRINLLLQYYIDNQVLCKPEDFEYTVLMDEPDKNLDIKNVQDIYNILSYKKEQTQIIAIIHNPALLYKLSKLDYVNFIEMTPGYIDSVKKFIDNVR